MDKQSQILLAETLIERLIKDLAPDEITAIALQKITSKYQKRFLNVQNPEAINRVDSVSGETTAEADPNSDVISSRDGKGTTANDVPKL